MATNISIINSALRELNVERINAITDNCKQAEVMRDIFDMTRREMLEETPFNFATKRAALPLLPDSPAFGYTNAFKLPADFIFAQKEYNDELFEIEGGDLLSDAGEIKLLYTYDNQDYSTYAPSFIKAFMLELAVRACFALGQDKAHKSMLVSLAELALTKARTFSSQQDDSDRDISPDSIIDARRR